jgi:hypothetical protein
LLHSVIQRGSLEFAHELVVINALILVSVDLCHYLIDVSGCQAQVELSDCVAELNGGDASVTILIEFPKNIF